MTEQNEGSIRCFLAVQIPADFRKTLSEGCRKLAPDWRLTPFHQLHITLAFMGSVPADELELVRLTAEKAASHFPPFRLSLGSTGCFPNPRSPRIFFVSAESPVLSGLAKELLSELKPYADQKPFKGHLTLARMRDRLRRLLRAPRGGECDRIARMARPLRAPPPPPPPNPPRPEAWGPAPAPRGPVPGFDLSWTVESFDLVKSTLSSSGADHVVLFTFPLKG